MFLFEDSKYRKYTVNKWLVCTEHCIKSDVIVVDTTCGFKQYHILDNVALII